MSRKRSNTPGARISPDRSFRFVRAAALSLLAAALAACGSGSSDSSGNGAGGGVAAPTVVVSAIGQKATSAAGVNPLAITVRSGADVQLSGENSFGGNISITGFSWAQTDPASMPAVQLLYRNASTVSFTAPSVAQDTTLNFALTVTNANGLTSTADAQVLVKAADDPSLFIVLPQVPRHFRVRVSTVAGLANLTADVPICVQLDRTIAYTPRSGAANSGSLALPPRKIDAKWTASAGGAAGFPSLATLSYTNPMVSFGVPSLNDEDVFAAFNNPDGNVAKELVPSDVDSAYVKLAVSATPGSCDGTLSGAALAGSTLMMQLYSDSRQPIGAPATAAAAGTPVTIDSTLGATPLTTDGTSNLTPDDILRATSLLTPGVSNIETRESAMAYYAALDPNSTKLTLTQWLGANCFDANAANYGVGESGYTVAHADYTNNYDLGFGRDMYFATCANGNMDSVVINYPSLESAANKVGAFLAVAMEYSPPEGSTQPCFTNPADSTTNTGSCITKFFAFAPDDRTGVFKRILTANFDRRGQKYLPGSCTVCHGGAPVFESGQPYPAQGDVDATFLPWDQSALLCSDTDPAFACNVLKSSPLCASIDPSAYSKATQAPNIQRLNALTFRTLQHPEMVGAVDRNAAERDLITKWYGTDPAASTAHAFDDSETPAAWFTPNQTASSPTDLYHAVYAHFCRSCHTQFNKPSLQFASYANLGAPTFGFAFFLQNAGLQQAVYLDAPVSPFAPGATQMPLSRLTTDRFWVDFDGGVSAAQTLAEFINSQAGLQPVPLDSSKKVIGPGAPQISVINTTSNNAALVAMEKGTNTLTNATGAALDASFESLFISTYQWSLCTGGPPTEPGGQCPGTSLSLIGTPVPPAGSSAGIAEMGASLPALPTNAAGTYYLTLTANSGLIGATPTTVVYELVVPP